MKLATYKDSSRDGQLVVVSRDLSQAHYANGIAGRMQQVLDDWNFISPQLEDLSTTLNQGKARHAFAFDPRLCMAPLPRAYQHVDGAAYPTHAARLHPGGEAVPDTAAHTGPALQQLGSDDFLGATEDAWFGAESWGIDFGAGLAAVTGDVAMGASPEQGLDGIRLLLLANGWRLHHLLDGDAAGALHGRPASGFAPVAVTPDELGEAWQHGRVHLTLQAVCNGRRVGLLDTGPAMAWHFGQLVAHLAKTRNVRAGSIVGTGVVSNADSAKGVGCLAEKRALEAAQLGAPKTDYLRFGDTVKLDLKGRDGLSVFGQLAQRVVGPGMAPEPADDGAADDAAGQPPTGDDGGLDADADTAAAADGDAAV